MAAGETHDQLELIAPSGQVRFFDLDPARGVANIGRHPDNDIVLDSPGITPFHAILDYHTRPYQLIWLDNATRPPRQLEAYDLVQLDGYSLVVVSRGAALPAEAATPPPAPAIAAAPAILSAAAELAATAEAPAAAKTPATPGSTAPPAEPEVDLDMLDAILVATEAKTDELIVVDVHTLAGDEDKRNPADMDITMAAGETATLEATITNGGDVVASFDVTVPGIPVEWVSILPARVNLPEGGRASVIISITPPRKASVRARGYFYAVVVRSPEYAERYSSTPGMLVVKPFYQFAVGNLDPRQQTIAYSKRAGHAVLPVVNQGNSEACFRIEGEDDRRLCRFEFEVPGEKAALANLAEVRVPAEQTLPVRMRIFPTKRTLVGLGRVNHPFTINVTSLDARQTPRSVLGQVQAAPLIGPIPIILLALLLALLFVMIYRPAIYSFKSSSAAISAGETLTLEWKASQFSGLRLEPGGMALSGSQGTVILTPAQDTLYTLTADNLLSRLAPKWFQASRQIRVSVSAVLPAFRQFSADRSVVTIGESVNVAWDVDRADSLTLIINGAAETLLPKEHIGNRTLKLDKKTTVVLAAVNAYTPPEGVSRSLVLEVAPVPPVIPPPPVIKRFDITPQEVVAGQVVMLTWEVTGVTKVTITGVGELPANGSVSVAPASDVIYTLTASNGMPGGSVSREQRVSVRPAPTPTPIPGTPKIEFFKATPTNAILGSAEASAVKLTWQVTGDVTNIEVSGTGTTSKSSGLPRSGTLTVAVDKQTLYILTAYNGNLSASQTVQVTVSNPVPVANSLEPSTTEATGGTAGLVLVVNGANFNQDSKVRVSGTDRSTTFISTTRLSATLLPDDVRRAGSLNIVVFTPTPGGGTSSLLTLTIINPKPAISQVSPPFLFKGGAGTTIYISGLGFVSGDSKVYFGATQRPTTFVNNTQLSAALTAQDLATAGTFPITVRNPGPGGTAFVSNVVDFIIKAEYPAPELVDIFPRVATVGGEGFTLMITGTNDTFVRDTTLISWQGTYLPNVVYSDTNHLSVYVAANHLPTEVGTVNVRAVNPSPGGGYSDIITFTMQSPGLTINPSVVTATYLTDPAKTLQVNLSAAQRSATTVLLVSSAPAAISVPSSIVIPAGSTSTIFTATAGSLASSQGITLTATLPITLGSRTAQAVAYINNPAPTLAATPLSPAARLYQSGGFTLEVFGSNFISSSRVYWNGQFRPTTYVNSTKLTAAIYAADVATGGAVNVQVFNPSPGGGLTIPGAPFDIRYRLGVNVYYTSYGRVASTNGLIDCGADCQEEIASAAPTTFTLQVTPASGFAFSGWSGDCSGSAYTCTVPMVQNRTVRAYFTPAYDLSVTQTGLGTVTSTPPVLDTSSCSTFPCTVTAPFPRGSTVYLLATAPPSTRFAGWGGGYCSGTYPYCTVYMGSPRSVTALFIPQYWLTVAKVGSGGGTVTSDASAPGINCGSLCQASYLSGTTIILTAAADTSSQFTGWGGSCAGSGISSTCTLTIGSADISDVTASFTPIYAVTLNKSLTTAPTGGTVTSVNTPPAGVNTPAQTDFACDSACTTQTQTYLANTVITLTASPSSGYAFVGWNVASCGMDTTCPVTINATRTITANFQPLYSVTVTPSANGSVSSSNSTTTYPNITCGSDCGPKSYPAGTTLTLTAAADSGYTFTGWTGGPCGGAAANPCVFVINQPVSTAANFAALYTLTVNAGNNGSVSSNPAGITNCSNVTCTHDFAAGTVVTLTATPDTSPDYVVSGWTVNGVSSCGTNLTCSLTLNAAATVAVTFARDTRTLTVTPGANGSVSASSGAISNCTTTGGTCTGTYDKGSSITLTATPDTGYSFSTYSGGGCGASPTCNVTLNADTTVAVTFVVNTYALTVTKGGAGAGTVTSNPAGINCGSTCSASYNYGTVVTLTATAGAGSTFSGWSGACTGAGTCTVTMDAAKSATATFTLNTYALTVTKGGTGSGTVTSNPAGINCGSTCSASYNYGTVVTLTATAGTGSTFSGWSGACTGAGACTVTMDAAKSATATFTLNTYTLTVTASVSGTVTSSAGGLNCVGPNTCTSSALDYNTNVTLTATASGGATQVQWGGADCTGGPVASPATYPLTMTANRACTADFLP